MTESIRSSPWFQAFADQDYFGASEMLEPQMEFPCPPYPRTPVGQFVADALDAAGMKACSLPTAIVSPGTPPYKTREALARSLTTLDGSDTHALWKLKADELWSKRVRDACNMCGFCGEYVCWGGRDGPKSGTHVTTLRELKDLADKKKAEIITHAKAIEVLHDDSTKRATGVRYLDVSKPDDPQLKEISAHHVIVSCGAVQSARLLLMSGPPGAGGLGQNEGGDLGGNATFHLFGFGAKAVFAPEFQGLAHGEFGPTGNTTSFSPYFFQNPVNKQWLKVGTLTSTSKKNPLENAVDSVELKNKIGRDLIREMEIHARTLEIRCTADDLPMRRNRVELDPVYVDEYGLPVARITRDFGSNEWQMYGVMEPELNRILEPQRKAGILESLKVSPAIVNLIGDHQMGTCRMSAKPDKGVVDQWCRLHTTPNVFVVDSSFMPTGLGLNPMLTVVANALRVGSWMITTLAKGGDITTA
jgi:choline dehydrogenase-like flavoprotein